MIIEIILLVVIIFLFVFWEENYNGKRIPGPTRLPIIGSLIQVLLTKATLPQVAFDKLSKKYGEIFAIKVGSKDMVVLTSHEDMKNLLVRDEFSGRACDEVTIARGCHPDFGIVTGNGKTQQTVRKFTVRNLRDFGFGKSASMEMMIRKELEVLVENLKTSSRIKNGKIHMKSIFNLSLLNIIWSMMTGVRYSHDDPQLNHLLQLNERSFELSNLVTSIHVMFPFLAKLFPKLTKLEEIQQIYRQIGDFVQNMVGVHREKLDVDNPSTFVDVFLNQIDREAKISHATGTKPVITDEQFRVVAMDLFGVGTTTMSGFLGFAILYMILHPEVQKKVQKEIDQVAPPGLPIELSHKESMIYTQATIWEVLRRAAIVPIIPPRRVMGAFRYKGLDFKKGMTIAPNLYSVFMDKSYWGDPEAFRPERFISPEGQLCNLERLSAFGFGKRNCMGESLAVACDFMFFTTILKHFNLEKVPNQPELQTEPHPGATMTPKPYDAIFKIRE